jgi:hypothetical protein
MIEERLQEDQMTEASVNEVVASMIEIMVETETVMEEDLVEVKVVEAPEEVPVAQEVVQVQKLAFNVIKKDILLKTAQTVAVEVEVEDQEVAQDLEAAVKKKEDRVITLEVVVVGVPTTTAELILGDPIKWQLSLQHGNFGPVYENFDLSPPLFLTGLC